MSIEDRLREVIEDEIKRNPHYNISASDMATDLIPVLLGRFNIRNKGWVTGPNGVIK